MACHRAHRSRNSARSHRGNPGIRAPRRDHAYDLDRASRSLVNWKTLYFENRAPGKAPTTEAVMQVARKPTSIAFQTMSMISFCRLGARIEYPATLMPTEAIL